MKLKLLADSGAYSSWRLGRVIDIDDYIAFVHRSQHLLACYINLDVIAGEYGRVEWRPDVIERAATESYRNHQKMKQAGLRPIPVFHERDEFKWLDQYLDDGERVIAVSVKGEPYEAVDWLDACFAKIGHGRVKVHGLGITTAVLLHRYPFASVDSSTWVRQAGLGQIPVPYYVDGKPNYALRHQIMSVTTKASGRSSHIDNLIDDDIDRLHRFCKEEVGIDVAQASESTSEGLRNRRRVWLTFFRGLQQSSSTEIVFVTNIIEAERNLLVEHGIERVLLSYERIKNIPTEKLEEYVHGTSRDTRA